MTPARPETVATKTHPFSVSRDYLALIARSWRTHKHAILFAYPHAEESSQHATLVTRHVLGALSMRVNVRKQQLELKVVYYGPGLSGKTTNLAFLHRRLPESTKGSLVQLDTEGERTLFFDYFPFDLGECGPFRIKVDFFTVPGQSFYQATRRAVLEGVDGLIFVADSDPDREDANLLARDDMEQSLIERGRTLGDVPHIYQWNKRDLPNAVPVGVLEQLLNPEGVESVPAIASRGEGVLEAQDLVIQKVLDTVGGAA